VKKHHNLTNKYSFLGLIISQSQFKLALNGFGLGEGGDFHHPPRRIDAENQTLINHKCVCGALNRHFCQTRVMPSLFFSSVQNLFAYAIH